MKLPRPAREVGAVMVAFLLKILDDGRLTDSQGRTVDFRNAVIIGGSRAFRRRGRKCL